MLSTPTRTELKRRFPRLMFGLFLFGLGLAFMVVADLGLAPWEVLHQGVSRRTGIPIGTVGIITGLLVLVAWFPIGERFGVGTLANVIFIGIVIDVSLWLMPDEFSNPAVRWALMICGIVLVAIGSGYYIGVHLGPGPRDGLMTGLSRQTGRPIGLVRAVIELSVLAGGDRRIRLRHRTARADLPPPIVPGDHRLTAATYQSCSRPSQFQNPPW